MSDIFYSTYNARHLAPSEVAETFIWSENFEKLIQNNHSIVLGARGCGKTTLMKMLTLPALHNWKIDSRAEYVKNNIPFYAIYVSTDIYWNVKNLTYGSQLEKYGKFSEKLSHFAVSSNVFTSLCDTFMNIISFDLLNKDENKEIELSLELIRTWKLHNVIPKLKFVKEALNERIDEVNQFIQEVIFNYSVDDKIDYPEYYNLSFESSLESIIPKFQRIYNIPKNKKWALCFDELEFAPLWLQMRLFASLRSRTQYILYKLSASPILPSELKKNILTQYGPTAGNDVRMIKMWKSKDAEQFSKKIIRSLLSDDSDLAQFFGSNEIYNKTSNTYVKGSKFYNEIMELTKKDQSFTDFLIDKGIDLDNIEFDDEAKRDQLFRKIKPIVFFRNTFIKSNKDSIILNRSRKSVPELYFGIEVLSKVCEGNPRWLKGIITQMLSRTQYERPSKAIQYDELFEASERFKNVISNIPVGENKLTIFDLIDRIGKYFNNQILGSKFYMDPKGTIEVDDEITKIYPKIIELIEKAVSQGALILLDTNDDSFDFKIEGQRFKLSYLFSILYSLPIRKYNKVNLNECMSGIEGDNYKQYLLFK
ncbi:ORC-CDC6 family AAA ATPase [Aureibaculum conchae]|uniref:ORC-CDC6 family AAA ATPase n=1 Tax=Aureibaculum sp. 2308TA14-22 TaxID=3108392 RepID=UPI003392A4F8